MIIWLNIAGFIILAVAIAIQENKINKLAKRFDRLVDKHNAFVDAVRDELDSIYCVANERIDEINHEFHWVYNVLNEHKEFADDVVDTMELMCDTDELIINRINDIEEDLAIANTELDDIIVSIFEEEEEEEEKPAKKSKKK